MRLLLALTVALLSSFAAHAGQTVNMYLLSYTYYGGTHYEFQVQPSLSAAATSCPSSSSNCQAVLVGTLAEPYSSSSSVGGLARYISNTGSFSNSTIDKCLTTAGCDASIYYRSATIYVYNSSTQQLTVNGQLSTASLSGSSQSTSECILGWLEKNYPTYLSPAGASTQSQSPYSYRYYSGSKAYLALSTTDNHLYYLGTATGNSLLDLGAVTSWKGTTGCN